MDFGDWLGDSLLHWLVEITLGALKGLWKLLSQTALTSPDVTVLPQVRQIAGKSLAVVNVCFVLAIITAGVTVMTHHAMQIRYSASELLPRLVVGWIAANFAMPLCHHMITLANALTGALTGEGIAPKGAFSHLLRAIDSAMTNDGNAFLLVVIGLVIAALTGMLLVTWLVRLGVLIVLVGVAPVALACHSLPYTEGAARLWWRSMLAVLGTVMLQALALHTRTRPTAHHPCAEAPSPAARAGQRAAHCHVQRDSHLYVKGKGTFRQEQTKSHAGYRTVTLPRFAVDVILHRKINAASNPHDAVFPSRKATWLSPHNMRRQWRQARADTGLEWVTPHTFRKTVATLLDREANAKVAAAQLGHTSEEVTNSYYTDKPHRAPDMADVLDMLGPCERRMSKDERTESQPVMIKA